MVNKYFFVASFTDAWIETTVCWRNGDFVRVASFTDAWIETDRVQYVEGKTKSHLLQMRGLKPFPDKPGTLRNSRIFYRCVD